MIIQTFFVDTFSARIFKGNPAAVCLLQEPLSTIHLQSIAREFNLPVTVFVEMNASNNGVYPIRYFTVKEEIAACGHATLAAAFILQEHGPGGLIAFKTIEERRVAVRLQAGMIRMEYDVFDMQDYRLPKGILESIGLSDYLTTGFCAELETVFIECASAGLLRDLTPDFKKMMAGSPSIKEVVVTSKSDQDSYDYLLRSFCPWIGIDEDPVTGSVHSVLAPYWSARLGKKNLKACQVSERGGEVWVKVTDKKVEIGGQAILLLKGEFFL
ncbi:MAG TPA: PhzF family phenazine biosynthesis protein [Chitinophagaceae bacterium]|nr:PhzF family phenazine biosynthesis protein [Chitinophagaceae bacterium]